MAKLNLTKIADDSLITSVELQGGDSKEWSESEVLSYFAEPAVMEAVAGQGVGIRDGDDLLFLFADGSMFRLRKYYALLEEGRIRKAKLEGIVAPDVGTPQTEFAQAALDYSGQQGEEIRELEEGGGGNQSGLNNLSQYVIAMVPVQPFVVAPAAAAVVPATTQTVVPANPTDPIAEVVQDLALLAWDPATGKASISPLLSLAGRVFENPQPTVFELNPNDRDRDEGTKVQPLKVARAEHFDSDPSIWKATDTSLTPPGDTAITKDGHYSQITITPSTGATAFAIVAGAGVAKALNVLGKDEYVADTFMVGVQEQTDTNFTDRIVNELLAVRITGANEVPTAGDDTPTNAGLTIHAIEAGGVANGTAGVDLVGIAGSGGSPTHTNSLFANDTDNELRPADPIQTTKGSDVVRIYWPAHGLAAGNAVDIRGVAGAVGGIDAAAINGTRTVTAVLSQNVFEINAGTAAADDATGGGSAVFVGNAGVAEPGTIYGDINDGDFHYVLYAQSSPHKFANDGGILLTPTDSRDAQTVPPGLPPSPPSTITNGVSTVINDTTVTIRTATNHGLEVGSWVEIKGLTAVGGIAATELNKTHSVSRVIDNTTFEVEAGAAATASAGGGGGAAGTVQDQSLLVVQGLLGNLAVDRSLQAHFLRTAGAGIAAGDIDERFYFEYHDTQNHRFQVREIDVTDGSIVAQPAAFTLAAGKMGFNVAELKLGSGIDNGAFDDNVLAPVNPAQTTLSIVGQYGTLTADRFAGTFDYAVANGATNVQALAYGKTAEDRFVYVLADADKNDPNAGTLTAEGTLTVTVEGRNDAPVNTVPGAQATNEDTALVFAAATGNALAIADADAAGAGVTDPLAVTLAITSGAGVLTLGGTAGLADVTGNGTATVNFKGTAAEINAALDGLKYTPASNYNDPAALTTLTIATTDIYPSGTPAGVALTDTDTVAITVNRVNDAPVNTVPGAQATNEDTALVFSTANGNALTVADVDAAESGAVDPLQVTLSITSGAGVLTLGGTVGLSDLAGDGTATVSFKGTAAEINAALNGLIFTPTSHFNDFAGLTKLTIVTNDQGNTGTTGVPDPLSDTDTVAITVNRVNDPPVNTVPGAQATDEDTALVFAAANGNALTVADLDAAESGAADPLQVTLSITPGAGALTLGGTAGLSGLAGNGTATVSFKGTAAEINAALDGLKYAPASNYNDPAGLTTLTIVTNDQGNTGSPGALSDTDTVGITVNRVDDAPTNTVPAAQATNEDTALVFSSALGRAISVADLDAAESGAADPLQVTLSVTGGTGVLNLGTTAGLSDLAGDGTATVSFKGTAAEINAALNGLAYMPTANLNGGTTLTITTNDLGNTGAGGPLADTDTVAITINAVNDAPVNTVPVAQSVAENAALVFAAAAGNALGVADVDAAESAAADPLQVTLSIPSYAGVLTLGGTTGLANLAGDGTASVTFKGTQAEINAALDGLKYTPPTDFSGKIALTMLTSDQGNTGSGGTLADTDTVSISVTGINNPPVNTVPGAQAINEDASLVFSSALGRAITVADPDALGSGVADPLQVTLSIDAGSGTLTLASTTGLSGLTGNGTATVSFKGTAAEANAAMDGLKFAPTANYFGGPTLTITTNDLGNTAEPGPGLPQTDTDTVAVTVNAVNDEPVKGTLAGQNDGIPDNGGVSKGLFTGAMDLVETADDVLLLRVAVTNVNNTEYLRFSNTTGGNVDLRLSDGQAVTATVGGSAFRAAVTGSGTDRTINITPDGVANIEKADADSILTGLEYRFDTNFSGTRTRTVSVTRIQDNGGTLNGGDDTGDLTGVSATVTINGSNDTPSDIALADSTVAENEPIGTVVGTFATTDADLGDSHIYTLVSGTGSTNNALFDIIGSNLVTKASFDYETKNSYSVRVRTTDEAGAYREEAFTIGIENVNEAPANTVPGAQPTNEDAALVFSSALGRAITVADVDAGTSGDPLLVTLAVTAGTGVLTLASTTGLSGVTGNGTATVSFKGTAAEANAAMDGLKFTPTANLNGGTTLTITTNDQGNTGSGFPLTDTDTVAITINAVNDEPVKGTLAGQNDGIPDNGGISKGLFTGAMDLVEPADDVLKMVVTVTNVNNTEYLRFSNTTGGNVDLRLSDGQAVTATVGGSAFRATVTGSGTDRTINITPDGVANIEKADADSILTGLEYRFDTNFSGTRTRVVSVTQIQDNGGTLNGGDDTGAIAGVSATVTINGTNDAPTALTLPDSTVAENESVGTVVGAFATTDADLGDSHIYTLVSGTGSTNNGLFDISGSNLVTKASFDYETKNSYSIRVRTTDEAGAYREEAFTIGIENVNEAPANTVPGAQPTNEDTALVFSSALGRAITVADVDAGTSGDPLLVTLAVTAGTGVLTLASTTGLSGVSGDGTATVSFKGTAAEANAAMDGLKFTPTANYSGSPTLTITTNDQGNTGVGGVLTDTDTVAITIDAVNDAPANTVPGAQSTSEDTALVFSSALARAITVADIDAGTAGDPLQVTLSVDAGTGVLTLATTTGLSGVTGDGTATVTFNGTAAEANAAMNGLTYTPTANYSGSPTLTITTNDQGNTGAGGPLSDTDTVAITVNAANDPPTLTSFATAVDSTNEDTQVQITFGDLAAQGNEADTDGTVTAFVVKSVASGTLEIGLDAGSATAFAAGTNDVVDATHHAFWTPAADASGTLNAFAVVAQDNNGAVSADAGVTAQVEVKAVSDAGTIFLTGGTLAGQALDASNWSITVAPGTTITGSIDCTTDNYMAPASVAPFGTTWTWGDRTADLALIDSWIPTGVTPWNLTVAGITAPSTPGTYYILLGFAGEFDIGDVFSCTNWGYNSGAEVWNDGNDYFDMGTAQINAAHQAGFVANWNALFPAGYVPRDFPMMPIKVVVNAPPTLTSFAAAVDSTNEDTQVQITLGDLAAQGNEADTDGTVTAFVVKSVASGTLKIGADAGSAAAFAAGINDVVDATHHAYWTPAADANGTLNAFAVVAQDNNGAVSAGAGVTAQVTVAAVNDAPTITGPTVAVPDGGSVTLTTAMLGIADVDNTAAQISIGVSGLLDGQFNADRGGGASFETKNIDSFTLQEVIDGNIQFEHNNAGTLPTASLLANDGSLSSNGGTPTPINFALGPLAVDLNGDGIQFVRADDPQALRFDLDHNGTLDRLAWVKGNDDGILVADADHDGKVSARSEFVFTDLGGGKTDLAALAAHFDDNKDGVINHQDNRWSELHVWQDVNRDGQFAPDEIVPLDHLNIAAIKLQPLDTPITGNDHVLINDIATLEKTDGSVSAVADVSLVFHSGGALPPADEVVAGPQHGLVELSALDGHSGAAPIAAAAAGSEAETAAATAAAAGVPAGPELAQNTAPTPASTGGDHLAGDPGGDFVVMPVPHDDVPADAPAAAA